MVQKKPINFLKTEYKTLLFCFLTGLFFSISFTFRVLDISYRSLRFQIFVLATLALIIGVLLFYFQILLLTKYRSQISKQDVFAWLVLSVLGEIGIFYLFPAAPVKLTYVYQSYWQLFFTISNMLSCGLLIFILLLAIFPISLVKKGRNILPFTGLPYLLLANFFLRHTLEQSDKYINKYLDLYWPQVAANFHSLPWWKYFIACFEFNGGCNANVLWTHWVENQITAPGAWYLFNAALIVAAFILSWYVFHSHVFSYTFAICMGFGTQLYHAYQVTSLVGFYFLYIFYILLLFIGFKAIEDVRHRRFWEILYIPIIILTAIQYEGWLDLWIYLIIALGLVTFICKQKRDKQRLAGIFFIGTATLITGIAYLGFKLIVVPRIMGSFPHSLGTESDVIFNYPYLAPAIEDFISNYFSQLYMVVTNFLPPPFFTSVSLFELGADKLIELQGGYHSAYQYLIPENYFFQWRYYAGAVFVIFYYFLIKYIIKAINTHDKNDTILSLFLLLAAIGGPTHAIIKARPMNTVPCLTYHAMVGVLGISLLIAYLLMQARKRINKPLLSGIMVGFGWLIIFLGSITRPAYLIHLSQLVGIYSGTENLDPLLNLLKLLGLK